MKNRTFWMCFAAGLAAMCSIPASAQVKPDTQVRQRQAAMILQGKYFYGHLRPATFDVPSGRRLSIAFIAVRWQ